MLRGVDRHLTTRLAAAIDGRRHPGYIKHFLRDVVTQRIFQIASGYEDGNDSNSLSHDPMFRLVVGRKPFDPEEVLASGATISRFEHAATSRDVHRASQAMVEQFIAGHAKSPKDLVFDLDHSEDKAHGQQPLAFYNGYYRSTCYLPFFIFECLSGAWFLAFN